jgi:heat shock protein HtpX
MKPMSSLVTTLIEIGRRRHDWLNALHTWILIAGSALLMAFIAWTVFGVTGLAWAGIATGVSLVFAGRLSPQVVLRLYRARALDPSEAPELHQVVRELAARAELPGVPQLYYVPSQIMNAFAVGSPENAAIAVTHGLVRNLTLRQLAGVLAHEISHVRNGDLKVMALGDVLTRVTSLMAQIGFFGLLISIPGMLATGIHVPWLALGLLILAPFIGGLLQLALSRTREYDADLDAAAITGDPEALASALAVLEKKQGHMWEGLMLPGGRVPDPSILRTHPKAEERIARLLNLRKGTAHVSPEDIHIEVEAPSRLRPPRIHWQRLGVWY